MSENGYMRLLHEPPPEPVLDDYERATATAYAEDHLCKMHPVTASAWVAYAIREADRLRVERSTMKMPTLDDLRDLVKDVDFSQVLQGRRRELTSEQLDALEMQATEAAECDERSTPVAPLDLAELVRVYREDCDQ